MFFEEEIVKNIIHYDDGSFDIIADKATYKECKYTKRIKDGGRNERKRVIKKN